MKRRSEAFPAYRPGLDCKEGPVSDPGLRALTRQDDPSTFPQTITGTDEELVTRAQAGEVAAFAELTHRHRRACHRRAAQMLRNGSDAEDEVQNALWKAFARIKQLRERGTFASWLHRIVENQCLMRLRNQHDIAVLHLDEGTDSNVQIELVDQMLTPEDQLGAKEVAVLLHREIARIPPLLRSVITLRDVDQLPMPEVAAILGISLPAAKSRLMRARAELRSRLQHHCGSRGACTLLATSRHSRIAYKRAS